MHNDNFNRDFNLLVYGPIQVAPTISFTTATKVDLSGYESATMYAHSGVMDDVHDGANNIYFELWECETPGGVYTKVADADVFSDDAVNVNKFGLWDDDATDEGITSALGYKGNMRYLEVRGVVTGALNNGCNICLQVIKSHARLESTGQLAKSA